MNLKGRVALVTGSAKRLGRAISLGLAEQGCNLALHYRTSASEGRSLRRKVREKDVAADLFQADLESSHQIEGLVQEVENRFGRIDILINNASLFYRTPWGEIQEPDWDVLMRVNVKAPFLLSQAVSNLMLHAEGGKIIHLTDIGGLDPWSGYIPYCVSKAALIALTVGMAKALAPTIQVNAVAPATVLPREKSSREELDRIIETTPLGRLGKPEDVVNTILYLLQGTDYVTGQVIAVDGGRSIR